MDACGPLKEREEGDQLTLWETHVLPCDVCCELNDAAMQRRGKRGKAVLNGRWGSEGDRPKVLIPATAVYHGGSRHMNPILYVFSWCATRYFWPPARKTPMSQGFAGSFGIEIYLVGIDMSATSKSSAL